LTGIRADAADCERAPSAGLKLLPGEELEPAFEEHAHSFVIRIWLEPSTGQPEWRGWIRHVQTDEKLYFRDPQTILPFLLRFLEEITEQPEAQPERLRELWRNLSERLVVLSAQRKPVSDEQR
jgi:hypothetical protein